MVDDGVGGLLRCVGMLCIDLTGVGEWGAGLRRVSELGGSKFPGKDAKHTWIVE